MINKIIHNRVYISGVTAILIVLGFIIGGLINHQIENIFLMTATFIAIAPISFKALQSLRMKTISIELLVTIAVIGALIIGEYVESSIVSFLFLFGAYLEALVLEKTRSSIKKLVDMAPKQATVIRNGNAINIDMDEVNVGDRVMVRSGEKIPVDGRIVSGQASINEAAITGESIPRSKYLDQQVFSGSIVDHGYIEIIAEKVGDDTTFAKIIELIEEAQESKSRTEKFLDRFSTYYTPAVVLLSIIVCAITRDFNMAITFLVIACPGALVIGAPVSTVAGIGNGAINGILVKGGEVLDTLSKVDTMIFDKTGTLTEGKPKVTDIKMFNNQAPNQLLKWVAEVEQISEHHLGITLVKEAIARRIELDQKPKNGVIIKGKGIRAELEGHSLIIGNYRLLMDEGIHVTLDVMNYASKRAGEGNTVVFIAIDGDIASVFSIADQIRQDAKQAICQLRKQGIKKLIMLTGDNKHSAQKVANHLGLDEYLAELLPEDKLAFVKNLKEQGNVVAMAGDGINDAPAIALADVGIAMGNGTDVSMETADVVLMADSFKQISHALALSKKTITNMRQNTIFAVSTVLILLLGILMGRIHLASGMFIHEASVLLVTINAIRLIKFRKKNQKIRTNTHIQHA